LFFELPGESLTGLEVGDDGKEDLSDLSSAEEEYAVDEERDRVSEKMSSRLTLRSEIGIVSELMCSVNLEGGMMKNWKRGGSREAVVWRWIELMSGFDTKYSVLLCKKGRVCGV
jgi:hypothetical protein